MGSCDWRLSDLLLHVDDRSRQLEVPRRSRMCIVRAPYLNYANYNVIVWSDENSELDFEISIMSLARGNLDLSESNFSI